MTTRDKIILISNLYQISCPSFGGGLNYKGYIDKSNYLQYPRDRRVWFMVGVYDTHQTSQQTSCIKIFPTAPVIVMAKIILRNQEGDRHIFYKIQVTKDNQC